MKYKIPCLPLMNNENVFTETASVTGPSDYKLHILITPYTISSICISFTQEIRMDGSAAASFIAVYCEIP
jgi:hypothetical protein